VEKKPPPLATIPQSHLTSLRDSIFLQTRSAINNDEASLPFPNWDCSPEEPFFQRRLNEYLDNIAGGLAHSSAARRAGLNPQTLRRYIAGTPAFQERMMEALEEFRDHVDDMIFYRAHTSDVVLMRLAEMARPEKWAKRANRSPAVTVNIAPLFPSDAPQQQVKILIPAQEEPDDGS
jgi:hypothetical protein